MEVSDSTLPHMALPPGMESHVPPGFAASAPPARTGHPPGVSPINFPAASPTLPAPISQPEHVPVPPALPLVEASAPVMAEQSPVGSPRGHPPIFNPESPQQMPAGHEFVAAEQFPQQSIPPPVEIQDTVMHDAIPTAAHPLATPSPSPPPPIPPPPSLPQSQSQTQPPFQIQSRPRLPPREFYDHSTRRILRDDYFSVQAPLPAAYMFKMLGDKLAGVIMGCTDDTKAECLDDGVFGLPAKHWDYLQNVKEGATFYLFNYSRRSLHGVFKSTAPAQWQLKPHGWCPDQQSITRFPAQIKVERVDTYPCLTEEEYRPILEWKQNYIGGTCKFSFELDEEQVEELNKLFQETKEREPNRQEPPIIGREQGYEAFPSYGYDDGYGYSDRRFFRPRFNHRGGRYGERRPFGRFGPRPSWSGPQGRGPRGRGPPVGTTHPLAQRAAGRPVNHATSVPARVAVAPPARPVVQAPPGMGTATAQPRAPAALPARPSASPLPTPVTAPPPGL